jgi:hypothetical protein
MLCYLVRDQQIYGIDSGKKMVFPVYLGHVYGSDDFRRSPAICTVFQLFSGWDMPDNPLRLSYVNHRQKVDYLVGWSEKVVVAVF